MKGAEPARMLRKHVSYEPLAFAAVRLSAGSGFSCRRDVDGGPISASIAAAGVEVEARAAGPAARPRSGNSIIERSRQAREHEVIT